MLGFKDYGILGQNARNLTYVKGANFAIARKLADSKLKTKQFLTEKNISVPKTLAVIKKHEEVTSELFDSLEPPFVVKPNNGYGWKGILIFDEKDSAGSLITNSGDIYTKERFLLHLNYILDGFFSLSGWRDKVMIEKKIVIAKDVDLLGKFGLPDIRVIVYNMVPVMAMLRVPTAESDGKANLHAWACGVWIDIWTGRLTFITKGSKVVKTIPGIWDVRWIKLPFWEEILSLSVEVQKITWIKYLGCDVVLDHLDGPLLLEMNIRPWLWVQIANRTPLKSRLQRVEGIQVSSVAKWVRLWRDLFSGDVEERIKSMTWKQVLGTREYITITKDEKSYKYIANIKSSQSENYIDRQFLETILKIPHEWMEKIKLKCEIVWKKKTIKFILADLDDQNIVIGSSCMKWFLVDPFKYKKGELPVSKDIAFFEEKNKAITKTYESQLIKLDSELMKIDKKLLILKYLKPTNREEEFRKFKAAEWKYAPKFTYPEYTVDLDKLQEDLNTIDIPDIPLSDIYKRKKVEVQNKIMFLKAFKSQNTSDMYSYSSKLFGTIDADNLEYAKKIIANKKKIRKEDELLWFDEISDFIKKFNHIYSIKTILKTSDTATARFTMSGNNLTFRKDIIIGKKEMRSVIAHEIEGHYLRKLNGRKLKLSLFSRWTANYLEVEEWIAIYNQNRFLNEYDAKYYNMFEKYYFMSYALEHSYKKLVKKMLEYYNNDYWRVFADLVRLKRWFSDISKDGCFMKDTVYLNGFMRINRYVDEWNDLKDLYIWKIDIDDLEEMKWTHFMDINFSDLKTPFFL